MTERERSYASLAAPTAYKNENNIDVSKTINHQSHHGLSLGGGAELFSSAIY
jgi:hypothetical protein